MARALAGYLRGERLDIRALATDLGIGRTTMHRWFGTRDDLLGEVLGVAAVTLLQDTRREIGGHGGEALLNTFDAFNRALISVPALRSFLASERDAVSIITRADHGPNPQLVGAIAAMVGHEVDQGDYVAPLEHDTLAFAIVRLAEAFLYGHPDTAADGLARLREVEAVILGIRP